jgi:hypothetical protein
LERLLELLEFGGGGVQVFFGGDLRCGGQESAALLFVLKKGQPITWFVFLPKTGNIMNNVMV